MRLYHGSNIEILNIDLGRSRPGKDFGKGFYLSDTESQARAMGEFRAAIEGGVSIVTEFEFAKSALMASDLKIKIFEDYSPEWVDFIVDNRICTCTDRFDYIYGPIADDKVGLQLRKFKDNVISKSELLGRLKYMKGITYQHFFGTEEALGYLRGLGIRN